MAEKIFDQLRQKEKEIRKLAIIEVAEGILHEKGLDAVTIRNVAKEAGLSSGAIYMYFKNKEELLLCMLIQNLKILKTDMQSAMDSTNPIDIIKKMGYHYKQYFARFGKYINILGFTVKQDSNFESLSTLLIDELEKALADVLEIVQTALATHEVDGVLKGLPPERGVPVLWALIQGIVQITLPSPRSEKTSFEFDQLMDDVTTLLLAG